MLGVQWNLEEVPKQGGAGATAFTDTLAGTSSVGERLAREGLQNSRDALQENESAIEVHFRFESLSGQKKRDLLEAIQITPEHSFGALADFAKSHLTAPESDEAPLKILYTEDFRTKGLTGGVDSYEGAWRAYLHDVGESAKQGGGGSFGFGKSVFPNASRVKTIIVYSVSAEEGPRLIGVTYQSRCRMNGSMMGPRAWLSNFKDGWHHPFVGDDAVTAAAQLGFERSRFQTGLSIMVVDCVATVDEMKSGIETHWWPAVCSGKMTARIWDEDGNEHFARPKSRPDLRPYIDAYRLATKQVEQNRPETFFHNFVNIRVGAFGLTVVKDASGPTDGHESVPLNRVALTRGPGMVVEYLAVTRKTPVDYACCFVASPEFDPVFRLAEPPAHDKWIAEEKIKGLEGGVYGYKQVKGLKGNLNQQIQLLLKGLRPPVPKAASELKALNEMLGKALSIKSRGLIPALVKLSAPLKYETSQRDRVEGEMCTTIVKVVLRVDEASAASEIEFILRPQAYALVDARLAKDSELLGLKRIEFDHPELVKESKPGIYSVELPKDRTLAVTVETEPFDRRFVAEVALNVEGGK